MHIIPTLFLMEELAKKSFTKDGKKGIRLEKYSVKNSIMYSPSMP